ncbi:TetR/AcrR family transcriptional regulator [Brevibacterium casei]|uniref:TetR/AcrR family transcriptional regulator n=1 Tax=Brevibacterium casei TaxID=33889 RepID=UPI001917D0EF|nr:TetR/AcrR family transcriptional regulator [Brevibacterium casei]QQT70255.1 TetR/AcrR family transcriptional regulator [Brevibacterium casei]
MRSNTAKDGAKPTPSRSPNSSPETAKRILDAAIDEFSAHGFQKTTVRGIAAAAGVSPGLVIHHFGSKEGLRTACDDHVFEAITAKKAENAGYRVMAVQMMFDDPTMTTYVDYLLKSLLEPTEHGQRYFDHYVDLVESYIVEGFAGYEFRRSEDTRGQAAMLAVMALAPAMLSRRLEANLGTADVASTMTRLAPHLLDLYMGGVLASAPDTSDPPGSPGASAPTPPTSSAHETGDDPS